jgi:hypothetical protein
VRVAPVVGQAVGVWQGTSVPCWLRQSKIAVGCSPSALGTLTQAANKKMEIASKINANKTPI